MAGRRSGSSELKEFLSVANDDPSILAEPASATYLATEIGKKELDCILKDASDLDITMSLSQVGLDSLMAYELRRWWRIALGQQTSVLEVFSARSIESPGALAAQQLQINYREGRVDTGPNIGWELGVMRMITRIVLYLGRSREAPLSRLDVRFCFIEKGLIT